MSHWKPIFLLIIHVKKLTCKAALKLDDCYSKVLQCVCVLLGNIHPSHISVIDLSRSF
jgi:hypothetical protein